MTAGNRSGAAHDGARSQGKAPEGASGGPAGEPVHGTREADGAEGTGGLEGAGGPEPVHDTPVTWPGLAGDEATTAEVTEAEVTEA